jgi:hypothetical protein
MKESLAGLARKATEAATARTGELTQFVATTADTVKTLTADAKGQLADVTDEMKEAALVRLRESLDDFNAALPVLRDAGYVLRGVSIKLGLPPQITASLSSGPGVSEDRLAELLTEHSRRKLTTLIVKSVYHATKLQSMLEITGMRPTGLSIDVGLIPDVVLQFGPSGGAPRA